jgi:glycyl-tRNA synthetase
MIKIYKDNGLPFFDAAWIRDRIYLQQVVVDEMTRLLTDANPAWQIHHIEAPTMIPNELVSAEYTDEDVFRTQDFTMKPETTNSSYAYAAYLLEHQAAKPPLCVWQTSKSYRRENDQVAANVRFKEFYQQEFQCIYTEDTKKDYHDLVDELAVALIRALGVETRVVPSDRLPKYSQVTIDIEVKTPHKWLEVCSISKRTDVPFEWNGRKLLNTEFAFGLDRLTYVKNKEINQ